MQRPSKIIYVQAFFVWLVYTSTTKILFIKGIFLGNAILVYGIMSLVSAVFAILFLFLFNHKDFFKFAKVIEKREMKKEKKWLKRFSRLGRSLTIFLIGIAAGPLLAALTARLLLADKNRGYFLVSVASILSTLLWLGMARGVISIF